MATGSGTVEKVYRMARRMAKRRSSVDRAVDLARGTTLVIDVLVGVPSKCGPMSTFPEILKGIHKRAEIEIRERPELGQIMIGVYHQAPGEFHPKPSRGGPPGTDRSGTILIYPFEEEAVSAVARGSMAVSVLATYERLCVDSIDTDDAKAVSVLVGRLHDAGHRRIGFLAWPYPVACDWVARRHAAYAESLSALSLETHDGWVLNAPSSAVLLGAAAIADAVAARVRFSGVTAWVCAADHQAYTLIGDLRARGLRVPEDVSVTGFDGIEPPAGMPQVDSMRVPHEHIGSSALTRMINRLVYPSSPRKKIFFDTQLVPGSTIAAPRQG
jgi:LacI family transcriptional regulator